VSRIEEFDAKRMQMPKDTENELSPSDVVNHPISFITK
jgi:hypothetical protein